MPGESRDLYAALGLRRTATQRDIKKAFRRLAQEFHPDRTGQDPAAAARFREVNEAYEVLADPERRARYDTLGSDDSPLRARDDFAAALRRRNAARARPAPGGAGGWLDLLRRRAIALAGAWRTRRSAAAPPADDGALPFLVTFEQVFARDKVPFVVASPAPPRTLHVRVPAGARPGTRIRLAGQGAPRPDGAPGDLLLAVAFAPHADFFFDGEALVRRLPVASPDLAAGATLPLALPDGRALKVKVPAGAAPGRRLRLRGAGLPQTESARGDLLVELVAAPAR